MELYQYSLKYLRDEQMRLEGLIGDMVADHPELEEEIDKLREQLAMVCDRRQSWSWALRGE